MLGKSFIKACIFNIVILILKLSTTTTTIIIISIDLVDD